MIKFGPSGNSALYALNGYSGSSYSAKWVKKMGLDSFEYSFGRGVNISREKAIQIGESFLEEDIEISVHAPYFINLASPDEEKVKNSFRYIIESIGAAKAMEAKRVVFHPAAQGKMSRDEALELTYKRMVDLANLLVDKNCQDIILCPETMGKSAQIGDTKEIAYLCKIAPFYVPCIDFGHINARENGSLKTKEDYIRNLEIVENELGREKLDKLHVHFSKIMYTKKGEVKHLTFADGVYGPKFEPLSEALKEKGVEPYIICESAGTQDIDALYMKDYYFGKLEDV